MRALRRWAQRQDWTVTHPLSHMSPRDRGPRDEEIALRFNTLFAAVQVTIDRLYYLEEMHARRGLTDEEEAEMLALGQASGAYIVQDDSGEDGDWIMAPGELVSAGVEVSRDWPEQRREGYSAARAVGMVILIMLVVGVVALGLLLT